MPIANPSNFRDLGEYVSAGPARGRLAQLQVHRREA
jgi:hypothetical protein